MDNILDEKQSGELNPVNSTNDLVEISNGILRETKSDLNGKKVLNVPIGELSALGVGVSSLIPAFRTITQTLSFDTEGLYTLANAVTGDVLKATRDNGVFWGALKTREGASKMLKLQEYGPLTARSTTIVPINPAVMLTAVALFSIEKELGKIEKLEKQILSFLEAEKESEIEADVETLTGIISKYKFNWDNDKFVASNHKLVLDIQRTARKNMDLYKKKLNGALSSQTIINTKLSINQSLNENMKLFKYFRLSLYTFSLASFLEIMLSGNFKEENVASIKTEISVLSEQYREMFEKCSLYIEKMSHSSIETNVLKGLGTASKAVGKFIGSIPLIKEGQVDEFLQDSGEKVKKNADSLEKDYVKTFSEVRDPNTSIFIGQMENVIAIYNHTEKISFDNENLYLVTDE